MKTFLGSNCLFDSRSALKLKVSIFIESSFRSPGNFPVVTVRIGEITAVPAPEYILGLLYDYTSGFFSQTEHSCYFTLVTNIMSNRDS